MKNYVDCIGPTCPLCKLTGPPDKVTVTVLDIETREPMLMTMERSKAIKLGLIKPDTTVLDDIVKALDQ